MLKKYSTKTAYPSSLVISNLSSKTLIVKKIEATVLKIRAIIGSKISIEILILQSLKNANNNSLVLTPHNFGAFNKITPGPISSNSSKRANFREGLLNNCQYQTINLRIKENNKK